MRNKLLYLIKYSLYKKVRTKWFVIANVILMVVILGLSNIDKIVSYFGGDFNKPIIINIIDNTNLSYNIFKNEINKYNAQFGNFKKYELKKQDIKEKEKLINETKDTKNVLIVIDEDEKNYIKSKIMANNFNDQILYQIIVGALNNTKLTIALSLTNIPTAELNKIYGPVSIESISLSDKKGNSMEMIMGTVFPTVILPFFMLVIFVIQMVGMEINEEKSTKGMEIIISNVSPQTHFLSKIIAANTFVIIQAILLILYSAIGLIFRVILGDNGSLTGSIGIGIGKILNQLIESGFVSQLTYIIPLTIILFLLSFLLYSLIAGIFASITVNIEDYQQIQAPIVILLVIGYYLSILAGLFEGSSFIKTASYIPFFSALLSPALLILNQITIMDVIVSILLLIITIYFLFNYGIKIYKVGILNYSSDKIWGRFSQAIKNRDNI